jgi:hypothetical protein
MMVHKLVEELLATAQMQVESARHVTAATVGLVKRTNNTAR